MLFHVKIKRNWHVWVKFLNTWKWFDRHDRNREIELVGLVYERHHTKDTHIVTLRKLRIVFLKLEMWLEFGPSVTDLEKLEEEHEIPVPKSP